MKNNNHGPKTIKDEIYLCRTGRFLCSCGSCYFCITPSHII